MSPTLNRLLLALLAATTALSLVGTASAHPIHNGCNPPQVWAVAYADQLLPDTFSIEWRQVGPARVPIVHFGALGDPYSGIVCIP